MTQTKGNTFGKLGRFIIKRKYALILLWLVLLAIVLPIVMTSQGVNSLQLGSASDKSLESVKAEDIISAQFQDSVANNTLVIVISADNASSLSTQRFIEDLTSQIESNSSITGVKNVTSIYSLMILTLNETNRGVYLAYDNGNLTYTLLYSVPAIYANVWAAAYQQAQPQLVSGITQANQGVFTALDNANLTYNLLYSVPAAYSTIWSTAYNQTHDMLVAGLSQANQGVYAALENANITYNMLYGAPAIFLNAWSQNYAVTSDLAAANQFAYQTTADILQAQDPAAFAQYTGPLLDAFNAVWVQSFADPSTATWTPIERAAFSSTQTNQLYINTFLAGNATNQAFVTALTNTLTFQNYLTNTQAQNNAVLTGFAIQAVTSASSGASSTEFVTAAYNLGPNPSPAALSELADDIIWSPATYNMGTSFISTFNEVAYNQTAAVLSQADPAAFAQYTQPLLDAFNTTWCMSFLDPSMAAYTPTQRASAVTSQITQLYINNFLPDAASRAFATALTSSFSLQDYLTNTQDQNNVKLQNFALNYVVSSSGSSMQFVSAAYGLGRNPQSSALAQLAEDVIWNGQAYMGQDFIATFNDVAYDQTATILRKADASAFSKYTSHLLDLFDVSWHQSLGRMATTMAVNDHAQAAASRAIPKFINTYFSGENASFALAVANTFTLQDFLDANVTTTNLRLQNLATSYVANQSGFSQELVNATFNLGENATAQSLRTLASNIVWSPESYNIGQDLNELLSSFVSPTKDVTLISVTLDGSSDQNLLLIRGIVKSALAQSPAGINSALVTGTDALNYDFSQSTNADLELILPITIALLLVATGLFFRSFVTPLITLGTIGVGLGISQIFTFLVGTYINKIDFMIPTVLLTVLIGVGTDYGIFVIARHREERIYGLPVHEAIMKSVTWAGESIATSGATVIISFLALAGTSIILLQTLGLVVGLGVIVVLLVSLTFVPALLAVLGDRVFWPNTGERFQKYAANLIEQSKRRGGYFARSGAFSVKHGKSLILIAVLVTVPLLYVYVTATPTYDFLGGAPGSLESIGASRTLTSSFGGGRLSPTYVVVTFSQPILVDGNFSDGAMLTLQSMSSQLAKHEGVQKVTGPTMPFGSPVDYKTVTNASDPMAYTGMLLTVGADNQSALITVEFKVDPYSTEAINYASDIRASLHQNFDGTANITGIYVGGTTGGILDTKNLFVDQFNIILPIVAVGVAIVLFIVLGSLILPLFAVVSVLMSIVWTLAITAIVFQSAFNYGLLFIAPLILFVLLLGLGMDYNIFILTRIREEATKGSKLSDAIVHGIEQTGGIITAAAIILAGSLGALMLSNNLLLKQLGFAFCFSILIDALVVRTYLVPAVMSTFGKWNWYNPIKRLRRLNNAEEDAENTCTTTTKTPQ